MINQKKVLVVIPARYASSRFPGKPLVDIAGKSMIQRVYEQVQQADLVDQAIVATDDQRIFDRVQSFGGKAQMTLKTHESGTDRCVEVASRVADFDIVLNVQGDEPFINPQQIDDLIAAFEPENPGIGTMIKQVESVDALQNSNIVKVVVNAQQRALYFSRQAIPFQRDLPVTKWLQHQTYYKHLGIYIFRRTTLLELGKLPPSALEKAERLEQLRWLENGYEILTVPTVYETQGIDTPEDLTNWFKA